MPSLDAYAQVTLNAQGGGKVTLGPSNPRVTWRVTSATITCDGTPPVNFVARFTLYLGGASPGSAISSTPTITSATDNELDVTLYPGHILTAEWQGGLPGAVATISLYGQMGYLT